MFIKSQFTTNAQSILQLNQCTHGHAWSWTVAPFQRSLGGCEWFHRHQKCVGDESLHFQLEMNTLGFSNLPTYKNLKNWVRTNLGLYEKLFAAIYCFAFTPEICPSVLNTPCKYTHMNIEVQYIASSLDGEELSGADGRAYWVWWSGEGWVFICFELHCDKVNRTFGGGEKD